MFRKHELGLGELRRKELQADESETVPQLLRRRNLSNSTRVHQRDAMAAFGFVEIRCGDDNCQPLCCEMRQPVPEAQHVKFFKIGLASPVNFAWVDAPQRADVTNVLGDAEVGVECKSLCKITALRPHLTGRPAQNISGA